jgi:hypothetical protein
MRAHGQAWIWQQPPKLKIEGSNPSAPAIDIFFKHTIVSLRRHSYVEGYTKVTTYDELYCDNVNSNLMFQ